MSNLPQQVSSADTWLSPYDRGGDHAGGGFDPDRFKRILTESGYKNNPIGNLITDLCKNTGLEPETIHAFMKKYEALRVSDHIFASRKNPHLAGVTRLGQRAELFPNPEAYVIWRRVNARRKHSGLSPIKFDQLFGHVPTDHEAAQGRSQGLGARKSTPMQPLRFYAFAVAGRRMFEGFLRQLDAPQNRKKILPSQYMPALPERNHDFYRIFLDPNNAYEFVQNEDSGKLVAHPTSGLKALCEHLGCKPHDILPHKDGLLLQRFATTSSRDEQVQRVRVKAYLEHIGVELPAGLRQSEQDLLETSLLQQTRGTRIVDFQAAALQIIRVCRRDVVALGMIPNLAPAALPDSHHEIAKRVKVAAGLPEDMPDAAVCAVWNAYTANDIGKRIIDDFIDGKAEVETALSLNLQKSGTIPRRRNATLERMAKALQGVLTPSTAP